ncbi:hypothetical protein CRENBAI_024009 [Crenichthys baileyi]|uniref:Uncharacterized protein n=1 Tax=Crenichthys baileyi TaxID=28760 RepID=A0AAV9RF65_9TELE
MLLQTIPPLEAAMHQQDSPFNRSSREKMSEPCISIMRHSRKSSCDVGIQQHETVIEWFMLLNLHTLGSLWLRLRDTAAVLLPFLKCFWSFKMLSSLCNQIL